VFVFKFPAELAINNIQKVTGTGIFKPEQGLSRIRQQFIVADPVANTLQVTGCLNPTTYNA
jgi:hypothetical protein